MIPNKSVHLDDIHTMFIEAEEFPVGIAQAFKKLESKFKSLKGKKFYGVLLSENNGLRYYACVKIDSSLDVEIYKLPEYVIPSGNYATAKIDDWQENIEKIRVLHKELSGKFKEDESRPFIEFYKSYKELILYFPVKR